MSLFKIHSMALFVLSAFQHLRSCLKTIREHPYRHKRYRLFMAATWGFAVAVIYKKRGSTIILAKRHGLERSGKNGLLPVYKSKGVTERHGPGA